MVIKGFFAIMVVALVASFAAVVFALDSLATARNDDNGGAAAPAAATAHAAHGGQALPLASFAGNVPEDADALAKAHVAADAKLPPLQAGPLGGDVARSVGHGGTSRGSLARSGTTSSLGAVAEAVNGEWVGLVIVRGGGSAGRGPADPCGR